MQTNRQLPQSKHFRLQQVADGVYAAIHVDGGAAIGNAGIVDLGDRTLVFDTFFTPQAAEDLRIAAEAVTGRPVDAAINSHYHNDHIWGNQVFDADTDIIATAETQRLIDSTLGHDDFNSFRDSAEANLEATRAAFQAAEDEAERRQIAVWVDYHQAFVDAKPILNVRPPNVTFDQRLAFHGTKRSAEVIAFARGHSPNDAVLFLPQEGIAFLSDLLFIDYHPWVGAGDPDRLVQILHEISKWDPQLLVPGHGPVGPPESLQQMRQYIQTLDALVDKMMQEGQAEDRIDEMNIPPPYDDWLFAAFFPLNMHFLYQRRLREQTDEPV
jgi:glyoxylase-like metal-dependent hydrolase (beta-lactamase superfamily II)